MATGKKISELPVATTLTGLELAVVVQNAETRQTTVEQFAASVSQRLDTFAASTSANFQTVYAQLSANAAAITSVNTVVSALEIRVSSVSAVASANTAAITSINNVVSALEIRVSAVSTQASINAAAITSINAEVSLKAYRSGDYLTNVRYIEFDTSISTNPTVPGKLAWNSTDGTLDIGLNGGSVLQVGQETLFYIKNTSGVSIADGQMVMATSTVGASGQIAGGAAIGDGTIPAEYFLGVATQTIAPNAFGYVTHFGAVRGFDATGSPYGETWTDGDLLYVNASVTGGLTNSPPLYPGFSTPIAIVLNAGPGGSGSIFVRMKSGEYLEQLHDVDVTTKAAGDIIIWNTSIGAWTNSQAFVQTQTSISALNVQVAAVSALTSVNTAAITSINNVVSALEIRVSAVSAAASANAAAITSTNNVVSALEIRVSAVSAVAGTNAAAITSINNVVSALEIRVSSVSAAVSVLTIQVNALDVSAVNARLDTVSAATSVNAAAITSVNAQVSLRVLRSGDTMTGNLTVPSLNDSPLAGFRNAIINGNFQIAQRGTSFVAGANNDDTYNLDRWYVLSDGNDVVDITQSTAQVPSNGSQTSIALDVETINKKFGIAQIIEQRNCQGLIGNTVTLSFKAKVSSTTKLDNVKAAIVAWSGTADTVTSDIISAWNVEGTNPTLIANATYENSPANLNVTTSWATYSVTAAVDTASTGNIIVFIWSDVTDTTLGDFLYITDVQLEIGSVATPFERRHIGTELSLSQRYYCETRASGRFPSFGAGQVSENHILWPVVMRAAPTITITSGGIRSNLLTGYPQTQNSSVYGARWLIASNASGDCYAVNDTITAAIEL
jgi:hypothetical protein